VIDPSEKNGLKEKSYIKCEQVLTISKKRLVRCVGGIEEEYLSLVTKALRKVLVI